MSQIYRVEAEKMQDLVAMLRPTMAADPKFMAECSKSMVCTPTLVNLYLDADSSQILRDAATKLGALVTGVN